jgi:hypothetical protein
MNDFFSGYNRYQVIFPYESSKQHSEPDLDHGAYKCYQELVENNVMTHIFIIHNIDTGDIYYFDIPKNKHLEASQQIYLNNDPSTMKNHQPDHQDQTMDPIKQIDKPYIQSSINQPSIHQPINQPSIHQSINQPSIHQPINQPSIHQPINQPSIHQPINQPSIHQPINQPSIHQPINQPSIHQPINQPIQSMHQEYDRMIQNDLVTRLNRVEYQLDHIQMEMRKPQKKEEDNCVLL